MSCRELKKILYVEDEPDIQTVVKITLQSLGGYEVKVCSSGKEALAEAVSFKPDLFLLDVMMPEMDGPTTLENLKKIPELSEIPAIFMTAKAQVQEIAKYQNYKIVGVITKPFDPVTLSEQIKNLWERNLCLK